MMNLKIGDKLPVENKNKYIQTLCCGGKGRIYVVYKNDGITNDGKNYPAYFYCSNCLLAVNGMNEIIGKYDPEISEVRDLETNEIIPYDRNW